MKKRSNTSSHQVNLGNRIWQLFYPLLVYYILYGITEYVAGLFFHEQFGKVFCLLIAGLVTLVPIIIIYNSSPVVKMPLELKNKKTVFFDLLMVCGVVLIAIGLNYVIGKTGLTESSAAYQEASKNLLDGNIFIKIICNAIVIPILEEYVFRGIICGQLQVWCGMWPAIIVSSLIFGMIHLNIVQFIYAFLCGLAIGFLFCKTNKLLLCILAHGLANFIVVIATAGC